MKTLNSSTNMKILKSIWANKVYIWLKKYEDLDITIQKKLFCLKTIPEEKSTKKVPIFLVITNRESRLRKFEKNFRKIFETNDSFAKILKTFLLF